MLNKRQSAFVREYLVDGNATQAAIRAGYAVGAAKQIGSRLLSRDDVRSALSVVDAAANEKAVKSVSITREWVLRRLRIESTRTGERSSHAARVKATEILARHVGLLDEPPPPPPTVNVNVGCPLDLKQLNDDQLAQLADLIDAASKQSATVDQPAAGPQPDPSGP